MTQEEIRSYLAAHSDVRVQVAGPDDGSPAMAWGDTFFFLVGADGVSEVMPFATIVTKDYEGFDSVSNLNRDGVYRLNIELRRNEFEELLGFAPAAIEQLREAIDFTTIDRWLPHPTYGGSGWVSIINPSKQSRAKVFELIEHSLSRHRTREAAKID
jgi:hypothetical protein